jgi:hypothetical protein
MFDAKEITHAEAVDCVGRVVGSLIADRSLVFLSHEELYRLIAEACVYPVLRDNVGRGKNFRHLRPEDVEKCGVLETLALAVSVTDIKDVSKLSQKDRAAIEAVFELHETDFEPGVIAKGVELYGYDKRGPDFYPAVGVLKALQKHNYRTFCGDRGKSRDIAGLQKYDVETFPLFNPSEAADAGVKPTMIVEGILAEDNPLVVAGVPKSFKTSLTLHMLTCIAAGVPFLGCKVPKPRNAVFFSGETDIQVLGDLYRRIRDALGVDPAAEHRLHIVPGLPRHDDKASIDAFVRRCCDAGADVVGVDPLSTYMSDISNSNSQRGYAELNALRDPLYKIGATPVAIDHLKKGSTSKTDFRSISGASQEKWFRSWLTLGTTKPYKPATGEIGLRMVAGGPGYGGEYRVAITEGTPDARTWAVSCQPWDAPVGESTDSRESRVLTVLRENAETPLTLRRIRQLTSLNGVNAKKTIDDLIKRGVVGQEGDGYLMA